MRLPDNFQQAVEKVADLEQAYIQLAEQCYTIACIVGDDPSLDPVKALRDQARHDWETGASILERLRPARGRGR